MQVRRFFWILRDIRHGYGEDISEKDFIDPYVGVKVLVIDELAKGRNTDWELTILDHFISTRYNDDDKVTLVTTNFSDKLDSSVALSGRNNKQSISNAYSRFTIEEKVGARIYSRLMEMCKKVNLEGTDYRRTQSWFIKPRNKYLNGGSSCLFKIDSWSLFYFFSLF